MLTTTVCQTLSVVCGALMLEVQPPEIITERWRILNTCGDEEIIGDIFKSWESSRDAEEDMKLNSVTGFLTWLHGANN